MIKIIFFTIGVYWIFIRIKNRDLLNLKLAISEVGKGSIPSPLREYGSYELRELIKAFNQMVLSISKLSEERILMIAGVSHDLRTSLTRMNLAIEMIGKKGGNLTDLIKKDIEECHTILHQCLDHWHASKSIQSEIIDINAIIQDILEYNISYKCKIDNKIIADEFLLVNANPLLIKRAISNLIFNAAQYGNGWIKITSGKQLKRVWFQIEDNGSSIKSAQLFKLFSPFIRGDNVHSSSSGSGLGLAIVQRIINDHMGSIEISDSSNYGGIKIRVWLPSIRTNYNKH